VSAATNLELAVTPAFGGQRPDVPWLQRILPTVLQQLLLQQQKQDGTTGATADSSGSSNSSSMLEPLLLPVVSAAGRLLQNAGQVQEEPGGPEAESAEYISHIAAIARLQENLREALAACERAMYQRNVHVEVESTGFGAGANHSNKVTTRPADRAADASAVRRPLLERIESMEQDIAAERAPQRGPVTPHARGLQLLQSVCMVAEALHQEGHAVPVAVVSGLLAELRESSGSAAASNTSLRPFIPLTVVYAAVQSGAAQGRLDVYKQVLGDAESLQLQLLQITGLHWAAVAGAAQAAAAGSNSKDLLELWSSALSCSSGSSQAPLPPQQLQCLCTAAQGVLSAMTADVVSGGRLTQRLLAEPLPPAVMELLAAALASTKQQTHDLSSQPVSQPHKVVVQALLGHAVQQGHLGSRQASLPCTPALLSDVLDMAIGAEAPLPLVLALLLQLLQQGATISPVSASRVLQVSATHPVPWDQLLTWLAETGLTAPRQAWQTLVFDLLQATTSGKLATQPNSSWQVFKLVQRKRFQGELDAAALAAVSGLIEQQGHVSTAAAADRVLQVWRYLSKAAAGSGASVFSKLGASAQQALLAAIVRRGLHSHALELLQEDCAALAQLARLWSAPVPQRGKQQPVGPELVVEALQACIKHDNQEAAAAAVVLVSLLQHQQQQQEVAGASSLLQDAVAADLVVLLSRHGQLPTAEQVFEECFLAEGCRPTEHAQAALKSLAAAAAAIRTSTQQQQALLQALSASALGVSLVKPAVAQLLQEGQSRAAAAALLLHAVSGPSSSSSNKLPVAQLLGSQAIEQVCILALDSGSTADSHGQPLCTLPSPVQLASECMHCSTQGDAGPVLDQALAMILLDAIAVCHPELQPAAAAAALGVTQQHGTPGMAGSPQQQQQLQQEQERPADGVADATLVVAQLCYRLLLLPEDKPGSHTQGATAWVAELSVSAAAAALFAVWYWAEPGIARAQGNAGDMPESAAVVQLCGALYSRVREAGRPSADSLIFDLGLIAVAAAAAQAGPEEDVMEDEAWREGASYQEQLLHLQFM